MLKMLRNLFGKERILTADTFKGAFFEQTNTGALVTVRNKKLWNENLSNLKDQFWPLIKEAYEKQESEFKRQLQITFENVDKIFIRTAGSKVVGFCCIEHDSTDHSVGILRDIIVSGKHQGRGVGRELYTSIFSDTSFSSIISASTTLPAILNRMTVGRTKGFETQYANMGSDNPSVRRLRELNMNYLRTSDVLHPDQTALPPSNDGLVLTTPDYILKMKAGEVARLPEGELKQQAERIVQVQKRIDERFGNDGPVVGGHLISMRTGMDKPIQTEQELRAAVRHVLRNEYKDEDFKIS